MTWCTAGLTSVGPRILAQLLTRCAGPSTHKILQTWTRNLKYTNYPAQTKFKRPLTTRVEEANLRGSVLPRQQSVLVFEAIAKEVKGVKFEENIVLTRLF